MDCTRLSDGELVGAFTFPGAEAAFQELVRRYGKMVLQTCRRVTGNQQDAEDAAQLVFAALCTRAKDLAACRSLGGWLYSTAWHVASRTRRDNLTRRKYERRIGREVLTDSLDDPNDDAIRELYRAIEMLPTDYCEAIVLHHLQGLTVQQVSELMACRPGTTAARLSRGRAMMRERLGRRGITPSVGVIEAVLLAEYLHEAEALKILARPRTVLEQTAMAVPGGAVVASAAYASRLGGGGLGGANMPVGLGFRTAGRLMAGTFCKCALGACMAIGVGGAGAALGHALLTSRASSRSYRASGSSYAEAESRSGGMSVSSDFERQSSSSTSGVPEPTSLSLVAISVLALRRNRRRASKRS